MQRLRFGTAGIPLSTSERGTMNGLARLRELNLDAMELEFVRSVHVAENAAPVIREAAKKQDIALTCHGQYYINLNAQESKKREESQKRVLQAARIASLCGAQSMTFHAAYYLKEAPEKVYRSVKESLQPIVKALQDEGHPIIVRPETTGKGSQWGTVPEIVQLSQEMEQVLPCVDFSHLHARTGGKNNTAGEFREIMTLLEKGLGRRVLDNMHIHLSGIHYTEKGERWHLNLKESDLNYQELLQVWKEFNIRGVVICESPNIEQDALLLQDCWKRLQHNI